LPRPLHSFPTRRSSDLGQGARSGGVHYVSPSVSTWFSGEEICLGLAARLLPRVKRPMGHSGVPEHDAPPGAHAIVARGNDSAGGDRKSTRLNSSHLVIS